MKDKKYFGSMYMPQTLNNFHQTKTLSIEEFNYLQDALRYAIKFGFKTKVFNESGKCIGLQG